MVTTAAHTTEIIRECNSKTEVKEWGIYYSDLWNVVKSDDWANLMPENGGGGKTVEQPWNKGKRGAETKHFGMKYNMTESGRKSKQESGKKMFEKNFGNRTAEDWQTHYLNTLGKITPDQRREIGKKTGKKGGEKWSKASGNKVTVTDINGVSKRIPKDLFWQMKNAMIEHNIPIEKWEYVQVSSLESKNEEQDITTNMKTKEEIAKEVHSRLIKEWSKKEQDLFFLGPYKDQINLIQYHTSMGRYIRNKYKLWENKWTPNIVNGVDESPDHPDAISQEIIKVIWKMGPKKA